MMRTNYHTHNDLCDGKGRIEEYIESAVEKGLTALGFSSHAPLPLENKWTLNNDSLPVYLAEVDRQKAKWKNRIQIYKRPGNRLYPGKSGSGRRQMGRSEPGTTR